MKPWLVWMIITIFLWSIAAFLRKPASQSLSPGTALTAEFIGGIVAILVAAIVFKEHVASFRFPGALFGILAGFLGIIGLLTLYRALQAGPVSIITPLGALSAVGTVLLGFLILHEHVTLAQAAGIFFAILAAILLGF